ACRSTTWPTSVTASTSRRSASIPTLKSSVLLACTSSRWTCHWRPIFSSHGRRRRAGKPNDVEAACRRNLLLPVSHALAYGFFDDAADQPEKVDDRTLHRTERERTRGYGGPAPEGNFRLEGK